MKFQHLFYLFAVLFIWACGSEKASENTNKTDTKETPTTKTVEREVPKNSAKAHFASLGDVRTIGGEKSEEQKSIEAKFDLINNSDNPLVGFWVGAFGKNKINITLSKLENGKAEGHSVCAGNYRSISGTYKEIGTGTYQFSMKEPGDDKYDGAFEFTIDLGKEALSGKWTPFKQKGNSSKNYTLKKKKYQYNKDVGDYAFVSQKKISEEDIENYMAEDLKVMRNEIYARHGYSFKDKGMRYYFEEKDWYIPVAIDVREQLTDIEVANIDLIYEYEIYYDDYYDDFGR